MAIDRIPGVGPANADIAATIATTPAVSAQITASVPTAAAIVSAGTAAGFAATGPTTTQIAAAVPTLAQINTAITTQAASVGTTVAAITAAGNSAGWGATGPTTTQIAAAVPTLTQINNSVATNAPSPNNWVFLVSGNLENVSTRTVTFTAYRKLRIIYKIQMSATTQYPGIRLNSDTGSNYQNTQIVSRASSPSVAAILTTVSSRIFTTRSTDAVLANSVITGYVEIEHANSTNKKFYTSEFYYPDPGEGSPRYGKQFGFYVGGAAITSVTVLDLNGSNFASGTPDNQTAFQVWGIN